VIEQGLVQLIQAGLGTPPLAPGGWAVQLPPNQITDTAPMAWTYHSLSAEPSYTLASQDGFTSWELRVDCHGRTMADAIRLARAIDGVLRGGYSGKLPDDDATFVHGIFRRGPYVDGFSDLNRSYVRTMEYLVNYNQI
jgi:hypothetical protein